MYIANVSSLYLFKNASHFYEGTYKKNTWFVLLYDLRQFAVQDFTHLKLFIEHSINFLDRCSFTHKITDVEDSIFVSYDVVLVRWVLFPGFGCTRREESLPWLKVWAPYRHCPDTRPHGHYIAQSSSLSVYSFLAEQLTCCPLL